jgi:antitoxin MazE
MKSTIRKMGNSHGVMIPKLLLAEIGAKPGDRVEVRVEEGKVVIAPIKGHPRAGWADDSKAIHAAGDGKLVWPEFANKADEDWES